MDATSSSSSFKTLNTITPLPLNFRSRSFLLRPFYLTQFKNKHFHSSFSFSRRFSTLCSVCKFPIFPSFSMRSSALTHMDMCKCIFLLIYIFFCGSFFIHFDVVGAAESRNGNSLPHGVGEAVSEVSKNKLLQVVLVSPQIPGNTGCIARTCAASAVGLHLVGPLGFQVDSSKLKRAGLDYWPYVVKVHNSWAEFQDYFRQQEGDKRLLAFTKRGTMTHSEFSYRKGDYLIFGSETCGLPPEALSDCKNEAYGGGTIRIPMVETYVRCLNLSVSVGIALYEASRQLNYEQLKFPSESWSNNEQSFITEDIFA